MTFCSRFAGAKCSDAGLLCRASAPGIEKYINAPMFFGPSVAAAYKNSTCYPTEAGLLVALLGTAAATESPPVESGQLCAVLRVKGQCGRVATVIPKPERIEAIARGDFAAAAKIIAPTHTVLPPGPAVEFPAGFDAGSGNPTKTA
jgi:hypothetical protein